MKRILLLIILSAAAINGYSQCTSCHDGKNDGNVTSDKSNKHLYGTAPVVDTNSGIAQSYIMQNVCGLNWEQSSVLVETRSQPDDFNTNGTGLPCTVPLTFSSCGVDSVVTAFLYFNGSYFRHYVANPASVTITNPAASVFNYLADTIGTGIPKCWHDTGTFAYRVNVTNCINGGGNYTVNITGTGLSDTGIDGITLLIIYVDKSATYSGSIVLYDGVITEGATTSQTLSGFTVCNATPTGQAFSIQSDMQSNVSGGHNTETFNGSTQTFPNLFYNFCSLTTSLTAAQTSTTYSVYTNDGGDCYSWVLAGLYWQNTNCQTCVPTVVATNTMAIVPPQDTICQGDSIQLMAIGDSSYIWAPATGLSCTNCPGPKASPNATTTYSVTGFIGCAIAKDTVQVVVNPHVSLTISPSVQICSGDTAPLTVSGGNNYIWRPSSSLSCNTCSNPIATPTATTTYTVVSGSAGCLDSATVTVSVVTTPSVSVVPMSPKICDGSSVVLTASGAVGYRWTPTASLSCNTCANPTASPTVTTVYTVVGGATGCRDTVTDTVFVGPATVATIAPLQDSVCQGDTVLLIGGGGGTYAWSTGQTTDSIKVITTTTKTYTLIVSNGACSDTAYSTLDITPRTTATISVLHDTICPGGSATISAAGSGGNITYKWSNGATFSSISVNPDSTTTYTVTIYGKCNNVPLSKTVIVVPLAKPLITGKTWECSGKPDTLTVTGGTSYLWSNGKTTTTYITGDIKADSVITLIAYNSLGCPDTFQFPITERIKPTIKPIPDAVSCGGSPVTLTATALGTGPYTYLWEPGGATTSSITVSDTAATNYTVTVSNGCPNSAETSVLPDQPSLYACCNQTILIGQDTIITASGAGIKRYLWSPSTGLNCDTCSTVIATPTVTTTYTVTGTDSLGCQTERVVVITVEIPCFNFTVPNVVTPDNPGPMGLDNIFYIKTTNLDAWTLTIFDRWGKEMFKSSSPTDYWTGTTEGGGEAPDGIYYYIINATCQSTTYKKDGFVQLIR